MYFFPLLFVAVILTGFIWLTKDIFATEKTLPVFRLSDKTAGYGELLLVRRLSPNGDILLKRLREKTVYQYDLRRKTAAEVGEDVWNNATEKISVCEGFSENQTDGGKYTTYGKYILAANDSPDKTRTAVLSAYGPKIKNISLMPFLGGGYTIYGTRYLEIKKASENYKNIGKPFRVEKMISPQLCWTEDGNSLVIFDSLYFEFSVADFNPQPPAQDVRNAAKQTAPKPDLSRLTGVVRDYGVDENGDGLFEKIAVEIETETSFPASYKIFVDLEANTGKHFAEEARVELKGGVETTKVLFDTKPFFDEKIEGVFKISFVDLDYKDNPMLERREDLGQTREYKLSQFERPNIIFTGENVVTPIDKNGEGKYERLEIKVGVDVLYADDYEFQGDLYDEFTNVTAEGVIEFGAGKTKLNKGSGAITFSFSGKKIIEHGVSGKFRLRNVVIYKKRQRGEYKENLLATQPFDVNQFESEN
jgi:hypothetical protein